MKRIALSFCFLSTLLSGCAMSSPGGAGSSASATAAPLATVSIDPTATTKPIGPSFLGLSMVLSETQYFTGSQTVSNPLMTQLVKNLATYQSGPMILRELADEPTNSAYANNLTSIANFYTTMKSASPSGVQYWVGVDFGDNFDSTGADLGLAATQASTIAATLPPASLLSFEIGNEPDLYSAVTNTQPVAKRTAATWTYAAYKTQYEKVVADINAKNLGVPFNGPTFSSASSTFMAGMADFITSEAKNFGTTGTLDLHYYGGSHCSGNTLASDYLMTDAATQYATDLSQPINATLYQIQLNATGHSNFRIGEMNSAACQGQQGLSDSFQSALWFLDTSMSYAKAGVSGVNIFTINAASYYSPFQFNRAGTAPAYTYSIKSINPIYYGMLMEAQLLQKNAAMLPLTIFTSSHIKAYAVKDSAGAVRVLLLNKEEGTDGTVALNLPGRGDASTLSLVATGNNYLASDYTAAADQITLGGQTFKGSADGTISGTLTTPKISPANGAYTIAIPRSSAMIVTIPQ